MHDVRDMERFAEAHRDLTRDMAEKAARFNDAIVGYPIPNEPTLMSKERAEFRHGFMQEELAEFLKAQEAGDLDGAVDAIIDLLYVAVGAMNEMGVVTAPCYDEVHRANMRKRRGAQTKRPGGQGFDAVKPEGWTAPSHADYLTVTKADVATIMAIRAGQVKVVVPMVQAPDSVDAKPTTAYTNAGIGIVANDDFEYVGDEASGRWEHRLLGQDGYVLATYDGQAEVRFHRSDLPQRMVVSLREIRRKPKRATAPAVIGRAEPVAVPAPKIMVLGYARHGKDTVAGLLQSDYGLKFTSSSAFCAERVVLPAVRRMWADWPERLKSDRDAAPPSVPEYDTVQECFDDRHNHRALWYDLITEFNTPDLTTLGRAIFAGHDVYCGIRNAREFHALRNAQVFDVAIWVDAFERVGTKEDPSSCTVEPWMANYVLDNNGSLTDLERNLSVVMARIMERGI